MEAVAGRAGRSEERGLDADFRFGLVAYWILLAERQP